MHVDVHMYKNLTKGNTIVPLLQLQPRDIREWVRDCRFTKLFPLWKWHATKATEQWHCLGSVYVPCLLCNSACHQVWSVPEKWRLNCATQTLLTANLTEKAEDAQCFNLPTLSKRSFKATNIRFKNLLVWQQFPKHWTIQFTGPIYFTLKLRNRYRDREEDKGFKTNSKRR